MEDQLGMQTQKIKYVQKTRQGKEARQTNNIDLIAISICDCLSKNPPSSHMLVFREIPSKNSNKNNQPCLGSGDIH